MSSLTLQYKDLWLRHAGINLLDYYSIGFLDDVLNTIASNDKIDIGNYGNFCGVYNGFHEAHTHNFEDIDYQDALDFTCFLHDHFVGSIGVDVAFTKSVMLLRNNGVVEPDTGADSISRMMGTYGFVVSGYVYRRRVTIILILILFVFMAIVYSIVILMKMK